jgi:hypothetical protein
MFNHLEEQFLHWLLDQTLYVGLAVSGAFTDSSYATEASGQGYARQAVTSGSWNIADAGGGVWKALNLNAITFPVATGDYDDDVVGWGLFDAVTGDNPMVHGTCTAQTIVSGINPLIVASGLEVEAR